MFSGTVGERLRACALGVLLALPTPPVPWLPAAALVAGGGIVAVGGAGDAEAQSRARSSGGYARPSRSMGRTPSFGGSRRSFPRTPSVSGGYGRPSGSGSAFPSRRPSVASPSSLDRTFSRQRSADALGRYRDGQAAATRRAQAPATVPPPAAGTTTLPGSYGPGSYGPGSYGTGTYWPGPLGRPDRGYRSGWFGSRGWAVPDYAYRTQRSFGLWDGIFLWFLLDNLTRPGYADFFHHHQNDPGYQQWRAEAERLARENEDIRRQLDQLDGQVAAKEGQPVDPNYLPPETPPEVAVASPADARTPSTAGLPAGLPEGDATGGFGLPMVLLLVGGGSALLLLRRRRSAGHAAAGAGRGGTMDPLRSAGNILRHKVSGEGYAPSRFRVGMTLPFDPTPFILAAQATKVPVPDATAAGGNALVSVEAVGTLDAGTAGTRLTRLYLPGGASFFQLHLGPDGNPDECRFFGRIDEVSPADDAEWAFWLDPAEGMIGWPEFQTKDGKLYPRAWAPGASRVEPQALAETVETLAGARQARHHAMLYAAPTGAAAPAPETEYVLVAAIEAEGQAWVEVHAGIDVNPAALSLA